MHILSMPIRMRGRCTRRARWKRATKSAASFCGNFNSISSYAAVITLRSLERDVVE